jgi:trehalose 6-phosphate phosphatase
MKRAGGRAWPRPLASSIPAIVQDVLGAGRTLLLFDFDGTLAPLNTDPAAVRLPEPVKERLRRMAANPRATVGIVSGRALADVRERAGLEGVVYGGSFGVEIEGRGVRFVEPSAAALARDLHEAVAALRARLQAIPHARVEDKRYTATVHVQGAGAGERARVGEIVRAVAGSAGLFRVQVTRDAFDILPRNGWHKGAAARWIRRELRLDHALVICAGDDATDEEAFAALQDQVTIKVGTGATRAAYRASTPADLWTLLAHLDEAIAEKAAGAPDSGLPAPG